MQSATYETVATLYEPPATSTAPGGSYILLALPFIAGTPRLYL
jgi:hypothetical protein